MTPRPCEGCTLCCKLLGVPEIEKPAGQWCRHCELGGGCRVYESRPDPCRGFQCLYTINAALSPAWKPSVCKFVMVLEPGGGGRLAIHVDTQRPDAWRQDPYLSTFHRWAAAGADRDAQVCVYVGRRVFVILPDRVADLGELGAGDVIATRVTRTPAGKIFEAFTTRESTP